MSRYFFGIFEEFKFKILKLLKRKDSRAPWSPSSIWSFRIVKYYNARKQTEPKPKTSSQFSRSGLFRLGFIANVTTPSIQLLNCTLVNPTYKKTSSTISAIYELKVA
jgi:hypothetical protein